MAVRDYDVVSAYEHGIRNASESLRLVSSLRLSTYNHNFIRIVALKSFSQSVVVCYRWEYYSMIYVRSYMSIQIFPRFSLALYLVYHFYLFSQPQGFHLLALLVMFTFLTALMIFCVRKYEYPAYMRGDISMDTPRLDNHSSQAVSFSILISMMILN
jgi:hypothetical protein